jgi:glycosyltransferase 2 family protein
MGRGTVKLAVKGLLTAVLLWAAFRTVDAGAVSSLLGGMDIRWVAAALFLIGLIIVADAVLLSGVMRLFERRVPMRTALLYSLVGWFFSNVAPSTVGGDLFRGVQLSRAGTPVGAAVRIILAIRLLSLATLVVVMFAGFPLALGLVEDRRDIVFLGGILGVSGAALLAIYLLSRFRWSLPAFDRWAVAEKLRMVSRDFQTFLRPSREVARAWLASAAQHVLRVGALACLAAGLSLAIPVEILFALTPAALLVAMVPISLGGWGVRELTFVYFLGTAGVSGEAALSLSIAFGLLRPFVGAMGGITWVLISEDHFRVDAPRL